MAHDFIRSEIQPHISTDLASTALWVYTNDWWAYPDLVCATVTSWATYFISVSLIWVWNHHHPKFKWRNEWLQCGPISPSTGEWFSISFTKKLIELGCNWPWNVALMQHSQLYTINTVSLHRLHALYILFYRCVSSWYIEF